MSNLKPAARYWICVSAAIACAVTLTMCSPHQETWQFGIEDSEGAYLDCLRIARQVVEPDLVTVCSLMAQVQEGAASRG